MSTPYETKDSGVREEQGTGAVRDSRANKGRYDLLPPHAIRRLAQVYERGAAKYADRNWEKGMPFSRYLDSALRHIFQHLEGNRDEDHLGHATFNLLAVIEHQERIARGTLPASLDDIPVHSAPMQFPFDEQAIARLGAQLQQSHERAVAERKQRDHTGVNLGTYGAINCTCRSSDKVPTEQPRIP